MTPFVREFDFAYGRTDPVSPLIQRLVAHNPGPFTFTGTGVYVVGRTEPGARVAVIDPGPLDPAHEAAVRLFNGFTVNIGCKHLKCKILF